MRMESKPKVAVFNRHPIARFGGTETFSLEVSRRLAHKYDITYFAQSWEKLPEGVHVRKVPKPIKKHMRWFNQLWYAIYTWWHTRGQFDIIHSHEMVWHADIQTIHCPPVKNKLTKPQPLWQKLLKYLGIYTSLRQLTYFGLEKTQFRISKCKKVVAVSENTRKDALRNYPYAEGMLSVILPGILPHEPIDRNEARDRWQIKKSEKVILMVTNDFKSKGVDVAMHSLKTLPEDVYLYIAGGGKVKEYQAKAKKIGVGDRVKFLGQLESVTTLYPAIDMLLHPTLRDAFPMVVIEAMYAGAPVIVSSEKYCGTASSLNESQICILQDPTSVEEVSSSINKILNNQEYCNSIANAGQKFAQRQTWDRVALQFDELYSEILACKK